MLKKKELVDKKNTEQQVDNKLHRLIDDIWKIKIYIDLVT